MKLLKSYLLLLLASFCFVNAAYAGNRPLNMTNDLMPYLLTISNKIAQTVLAKDIEADLYLKKLNSPLPVYTKYNNEAPIYSIFMREEFVLPADKRDKMDMRYIGTYNLATCVALLFVTKKDGKVIKTSVAHIDALTSLKNIGMFARNSINGGDSVDIIVVSRDNPKKRAVKILKTLFTAIPNLEKESKLYMDLTASESIALNTYTGRISKNLPRRSMIFSRSLEQSCPHGQFYSGPYANYSPLVSTSFVINGKEVNF